MYTDIDVSIIYVNYFTSDLIYNSVKSIINKIKNLKFEIIVVDNNSEPDLSEKFRAFIEDGLRIQFVYLKENKGFGGANNAGAKKAIGEYLFFLNPDTLLLNNALEILAEFLDSNPQAGGCGGNLFSENQTPAFSYRKEFPGLKWEMGYLTHQFFRPTSKIIYRYHNFSTQPIEVSYISGADMMLRKSIWGKCKGFSEDIFMYYDDADICYKIQKLGYKLYNVPAAQIIHLEGKSFKEDSLINPHKIKIQEKSRITYLNKNMKKWRKFLTNGVYYLFLSSRGWLLSDVNQKEYYHLRKFYFRKFLRED
ncbi:MAG: glycosyltransferase family 2 protein [Muribaculaceae bacterium]|nr:glycosyltransferase family 2 protein [Muribaculaceae bacterium]